MGCYIKGIRVHNRPVQQRLCGRVARAQVLGLGGCSRNHITTLHAIYKTDVRYRLGEVFLQAGGGECFFERGATDGYGHAGVPWGAGVKFIL